MDSLRDKVQYFIEANFYLDSGNSYFNMTTAQGKCIEVNFLIIERTEYTYKFEIEIKTEDKLLNSKKGVFFIEKGTKKLTFKYNSKGTTKMPMDEAILILNWLINSLEYIPI